MNFDEISIDGSYTRLDEPNLDRSKYRWVTLDESVDVIDLTPDEV
jgi:hypothetical protein